MKRLFLPVLLICVILLACTFSGGKGTATPGNQGNSLLSDPQVGLDSLEDYTASLTVSFKGTQAGQPADQTDSYVQSVWPKLPAQFTSIHTTDDSGAPQVLLSGAVGDALYYQADPASPCTVDWGAASGGPADFQPAALLPAVTTAKLADEQTLDGVATRHYTFDAASLGLPSDATASGETWIAKTGGYVMKYVLDITGADSIFGTGITGTRHMEYALSDIGAHAQVIYPAGCEPVLSDVPAMDNATDLIRLPGLLAYSTSSTAADIFAFYEDKLTAMGWQKLTDDGIGTDSATTTFNRSDSNVGATVAVDKESGVQQVTVMIPVQGSAAGSSSVLPSTQTPNPNFTPTSGPTADASGLDLPNGVTIYPGATGLDKSGLGTSTYGLSYIMFSTSDSASQVITWYHQHLEQAGWTAMPVATPVAPSDNAMGMWYMGKYTLTISASPAKSGGTQVRVSWLGG
jgi:hypothetical protein